VRGRVKSGSQPIHPQVEIELEKAPQSEEDQAEERTVVTPRVRMHELLRRPFDVRSFAMTGLFVLAIFYTIYFLRSLLLPFVLALLLSYLFRPIVRILVKGRRPSLLSAALVMAWVVGLMGYGISFLATPAAEWIEKAP
jgi:predicted PurR-regulated permease PerM